MTISALLIADRDFDFDAYQTRYVALQFFYMGGNYHGFAAQCGTEVTIEVSTVLHALSHSASAVHSQETVSWLIDPVQSHC